MIKQSSLWEKIGDGQVGRSTNGPLSCLLVLSVVRPLTPEAGVFPCYIPIAGISESYLRNPSLGAMHTTSFDFFRCVIH